MRHVLIFVFCFVVVCPKTWGGASRDFDGTSDSVIVADGDQFDLGTTASIGVWYKLDTAAGETFVVEKWQAAAENKTAFHRVVSTTVRAQAFFHAHTATAAGASTIGTGTWYHHVIYADGTNDKVYLNGVEDGSSAQSTNIADGTGSIRIGDGAQGGSDVDGRICYVSWSNAAMTVQEINELMWNPEMILSGRQGFWPIWGTESPEIDLSGGGKTGSVTGTTESFDGPPVAFGMMLPL